MRAGLSAGEVAGWAQASDGLIAGFYLVDSRMDDFEVPDVCTHTRVFRCLGA